MMNHTHMNNNSLLTLVTDTLIVGYWDEEAKPVKNSSVSNSTRSKDEIIICVMVLAFILVMAVLGNISVIFAVCKSKRLIEQPSNLFIVSLSVNDLCSAVFVMFPAVASLATDTTSLSPTLCNIQCAANYMFIIVSMMTLAFISADRYIAILHPLRYSSYVTRKRVLCLIAYPWIQGLAFALPPWVLNWVKYDYWEAVCAIDWSNSEAIIYVIVACLLCFLLPGGVMVICYIFIIREARLCQRNIPTLQVNGQAISKLSESMKIAIKTITSLVVVVITFFVCMTPFCLTKLLKVVIADDYVPNYINLTASYFGYLSSVVNPFIYGIFRKEFSSAYRQMYHKVFVCSGNNAVVDSEIYSLTAQRRNSQENRGMGQSPC